MPVNPELKKVVCGRVRTMLFLEHFAEVAQRPTSAHQARSVVGVERSRHSASRHESPEGLEGVGSLDSFSNLHVKLPSWQSRQIRVCRPSLSRHPCLLLER